jgi:alanine-synthesizing transaminase
MGAVETFASAFNRHFGARLRSRRKALGLSATDVIVRLHNLGEKCSVATYGRWEAGKSSPNMSYLSALASALDTTISWLVDQE